MLIRTLLFKIATTFDPKGFEEADKAAEELKKEAKETAKEVEDLGHELDKEAKEAKRAAKATDKAGKEIKQAGKEAKKTGKQAGFLGKIMAQAATGIATAFASAGLDTILRGIADAIAFVGDKTAELDVIAKRAQKTGFGVEDFQRLSHVATLSGTDIEKLTKGINNLEIQLDVVARTGGGPASEALRDLGLTFEDLAGLSPTEQLKLVSSALAEIPSESDRSRQAFKLMGEEGRELIPLFNSGADAIQGMVDATGHVFTRAALAKAEAYQDALAGVDKTIADLKGRAALGLVPVFQRIAELADLVIPVIEEWAKSFADRLEPSITRLIEAIQPWVDRGGGGLLDLLSNLLVPLEMAADAVAAFSDQISFLLEVGDDLLTWIDEILSQMEQRWPAAFETAGSVVNALVSPLDTARKLIAEIFDFIERSAGEIEGVGDTIRDIKGTLGLGDGKGSAGTAGSVAAFRAAQAAQNGAAERARRSEERRLDKAAARAAGQDERTRVNADADRRRNGRGGGGGGSGGGFFDFRAQARAEALKRGEAFAEQELKRLVAEGIGAQEAIGLARASGRRRAEELRKRFLEAGEIFSGDKGGLLETLGLRSPGAVLAGRPAPQTLTIIVSPIIKMIETLTITVEGGGSPEQTRALEDAATQARDQIFAKLSDLPPLVEAMFRTDAKALRAASGGGRTPRGVP